MERIEISSYNYEVISDNLMSFLIFDFRGVQKSRMFFSFPMIIKSGVNLLLPASQRIIISPRNKSPKIFSTCSFLDSVEQIIVSPHFHAGWACDDDIHCFRLGVNFV